MQPNARLLIYSVIAAGLGVLLWALAHWQSEDPVRFAVYVALAIIAAKMKINFRKPDVSLSVGFVVAYVALFNLHLSEAVAFGCLAVIGPQFFRVTKAKLHQICYNVGTVSLGAAVSSYVFNSLSSHFGFLGQSIAVLAAAAAFFFINTALITAAAVSQGHEPLVRTWRVTYLWAFPYYLGGGALAGLYTLVANTLGWQNALLLLPIAYLFYHAYLTYQGRMEDSEKHASEIAGLHLRTIEALALAIEAKDNTTHAHLRRVQTYAVEIGKEIGMVDGQIEALRAAAILHDIGKLAVPEYIICKPGKLTPDEFDKMKIHPVVGAEILEHVRFPYPVAPIVRSHHEKWNGAGYPDGLKGEEIPLGARILAVVDCLDALASDRQYRRALPLEEAMNVVRSETGKSFDPRVVEILDRRYHELDKLAQAACKDIVKLSTDVRIERGIAPAAGFEQAALVPPPMRAAGETTVAAAPPDFLGSIAAARSEVQFMLDLTQELGNSLSFSETMSLVAGRVRNLIPHESIALYGLQDRRLSPLYVQGENQRLLQSLRIPLGEGLAGWVAQNHRPILNGNPAVEPGYLNDPNKFTTLRSALAVPLQGVNGFEGVLVLYSSERDAFQKDHLRVLQAVGAKLSVSVENALRFQEARSQSNLDPLTGLPNFHTLLERLDAELSRSKRQNDPLTVLVVALSDWRIVHDRFGLLTANRLAQATASQLRSMFRDYDLVARMGADEFVIILPGAIHDAAIQKLSQIRDFTTQASLQICEEDLGNLSAGWASYPADGESLESLLNEADRRRYQGRPVNRRPVDASTKADPKPVAAPAVADGAVRA